MLRITATLLAFTLLLSAAPLAQMTPSGITLPIRLRAFAVNMSNIGGRGPGSAIVEVRITQWSPAADRRMLIDTMLAKGQDALVRALEKLPAKGRMRFPNLQGPDPNNLRLGWDLRYTAQTPLPDGGARIVIALGRYMSFGELTNQPRTVDYPFTLFEIRLGKDGKGEGKMAYATKIAFDKKNNNIELENYSSEPVRLTSITSEKG